MPTLRIATFNVENLFTRPEFADVSEGRDAIVGLYRFADSAEGRIMRRAAEATLSDDFRQLTAEALIDANADFVALQEVDSEDALTAFRDTYLHRTLQARVAIDLAAEMPALRHKASIAPEPARELGRLLADARARAENRHFYPTCRVVEGNDNRGIDVGFLSRARVANVISHAHLTYRDLGLWNADLEDAMRRERQGRTDISGPPTAGDRIFRRDCLEVELDVGGAPLVVYICHFKSNNPYRKISRPIRLAEASAVRKIIESRFGASTRDASWVICGDLNDYMDVDGDADMPDLKTGETLLSALTPFAGGQVPFAVDVNSRIADPKDRWTSYFPRDGIYTQLDHIYLSPGLAARNPAARPDIIRNGQPYRARRYAGPRYPRVGIDRPKASDHCPIAITLTV